MLLEFCAHLHICGVFVALYVIFCRVCKMIFTLTSVKLSLKKENFTQVIYHKYQDFSSAFSIHGILGSQKTFVRRPCAKNTKKQSVEYCSLLNTLMCPAIYLKLEQRTTVR